MGNQPSTNQPNQPNQRRNNDPIVQSRHPDLIRKSITGSKRTSKSEQKAREIETAVKELRRAIDNYEGVRGTPNYKALHSQLSRKGQEVQELLMKSNKPDRQTRFRTFQKEINNLFKLLEEKVETNERQLDSAAVESHSFIAPKVSEYKPQISHETNLDEVQQRTTILEDEINKAISLEDKSKFKLLEQKLNMLYSDLTKVEDSGVKSDHRRDSINRSLMRQAKKLQNVKQEKRNSLKKPIDEKAKEEKGAILKIEEELSDVEVKVMTFDELKSDAKYREIDQILKGYWANLSNLGDTTEENRRRKLKTIDLIKKMLQELLKRATENEAKINLSLDKINDVEDDILALKNSVDKFSGVKNDEEFNNLDQKLRSLWAKLNDVHNNYEAVVKRKDEIVEMVQTLLKTLVQRAEKNSKNEIYGNLNGKPPVATPREAQSSKSYLLEDLEEYENKWIVLDKSIKNHMKKEEIEHIQSIVMNLQRNFSETIRYLNRNSLRHSTGNIAKISSSPLNYLNQQQQHPVIEKVTIRQTETEPLRKIASSHNLDRDSLNMSPPERLISEMTISRALSSINIIDQQADLLKTKILRSDQIDENVRQELDQLQIKLMDLEIRPNPTVEGQRNRTASKLAEISILLENAKTKKETTEETHKLKLIVEEVQKLKKKVDCFTGTYKSVLYVNIENGLKDCIEALGNVSSDNEKIKKTKEQLKVKIERYLEILDERSLKVSSQEDLTAEGLKANFNQQASSIVSKLTTIRTSLESFDGGPESAGIKSDIDNCQKLINELKPENPDQNIIQNQYIDYLNRLKLYFESRTGHEEEKSDHQSINSTGKTLMQLEIELTELKNQITKLNTIENDSEFERTQLELDDLLVRVNSVEILTQNDKDFKNNLQGSIQSLNGLLKTKRRASKRMSQYNEQLNKVKLEEVQEAIGKLSDEVYNFSEENYRKRYDELDEQMANIFLKIQGLEIDGSMRDYLIRQIQSHKKHLQKKLQDIRGTEV